MKRFLAYFCCIFTLLGQSFSCLANDNIVEVPKLEIFCIKIPQLS